jgi:hypothetical protein
MAFVQQKIHHVIYIIKENKTYDQILGDLERDNGDPSLNQWPEPVSPNHHNLALTFGLLDNFYDTGDVSGTGWDWSTYVTPPSSMRRPSQSTMAMEAEASPAIRRAVIASLRVGVPEFAPNPSPLTERLLTLLDPTGNSNIFPVQRM